MSVHRVVVVGGGASGTLLASELLRQPTPPVEVLVVEPRASLGKGLAYSTESPAHRLNVRAGRLSARADDTGDFLRWLRQGQGDATEDTFAHRRLYGRYLAHTLAEAERGARAAGSTYRHVVGRAASVGAEGDRWRVELDGAPSITADVVVLALGNASPTGFPAKIPEGTEGRFVGDPWRPGALDVPPGEDVLLVGTGLRAIDVALELRERGHRGRIHAVSRRGLVPKAQAASQPPLAPAASVAGPTQAPAPASTTARVFGDPKTRTDLNRLTRAFRDEARRLLATGGDWHDIFEAARPLTVALWAGLSWDDRRRFLRHLQPYWDVHRHRMAGEVADAILALRKAGTLEFRAARLASLGAVEGGIVVTLAPRGRAGTVDVEVGRVILCTGPGPLSTSREPLLLDLVGRGLVRFDPLGLGFDALPDGRLVAASGRPSHGLFALGPVLKGMRWETTAIPEIRVQAAALGRRIGDFLRLVSPSQRATIK